MYSFLFIFLFSSALIGLLFWLLKPKKPPNAPNYLPNNANKNLVSPSILEPKSTNEVDFFDDVWVQNVFGVSKNYNYFSSTSRIISELSIGSNLYFKLTHTPNKYDARIKVVTPVGKQIGWYLPSFYRESEIYEQLLKNNSPEIEIINKGIVDDPEIEIDRGEPIWWCTMSIALKLPYLLSEPCFYVSLNGKKYHSSPSCHSFAKRKVPQSHIEYKQLSPCTKCFKET